MAFKIALLLAFGFQLAAAILALRLNVRYRIYSAWFFVSASAVVAAILRLTTLCETWTTPPDIEGNWVQWASAFVSLVASVLLLAGMSVIEPFFKQMAQAQETLRNEHKQLESIVKETEEELRLAQRIQRRLLPSTVPNLPHMEVYGQSNPAVWTSGDYFDYLTLRDGSTAIVVADVSGHGLGPALLMSSTRASFRGIAPTTSDVGELLTNGNLAVADSVSDREFVTAMAVQFDYQQRTLTYAGAGHAGYLLRADGSSEMLPSDAPPLGILTDLTICASTRTEIMPGDILLLVTDGILETCNESGEMFGESSLTATVSAHRTASAEKIVHALLSAAQEFSGQQPQQDDITAVVVKFL
ncbi:MAG: SpoIIE family protein phosphatase [Planctomycetales bacterium]|nr:SpoIIE family protein phosphatase [Planctomycetales bacterium]